MAPLLHKGHLQQPRTGGRPAASVQRKARPGGRLDALKVDEALRAADPEVALRDGPEGLQLPLEGVHVEGRHQVGDVQRPRGGPLRFKAVIVEVFIRSVHLHDDRGGGRRGGGGFDVLMSG